MEWVLQLGKPTRRRVLPIRSSPLWIGRDRSCPIRITSTRVSRFHCALILQSGNLYISDEIAGTALS